MTDDRKVGVLALVASVAAIALNVALFGEATDFPTMATRFATSVGSGKLLGVAITNLVVAPIFDAVWCRKNWHKVDADTYPLCARCGQPIPYDPDGP